MDAPSQQPKSGLPRPAAKTSKLPVLRTRPVPDVNPAAAETQSPSSAVSSTSSKNINGTSRLAKRVSSASLPQSAQISSKPAAAPSKLAPPRANLSNGTKHIAKQPSRNNLRFPSGTIAKPAVPIEEGEHHDQLGSLDSFRSASRQGMRSGSFEEALTDDVNDANATNGSSDARGRRSSRPSLSDRTIESLQSVPTTPKDRRRSSFFNPTESPMGPPPRPASSMSRNGSRSRPGTSDGTFRKPSSRPSSPAKKAPASAQPTTRTVSRVPSFSSLPSNRRSVSGSFVSKLQGVRPAAQKTPAKPASGELANTSKPLSKPTPTRLAKPKPALGAAFAPAKKARTATGDVSERPKRVVSNSSAALRQQIAAAKAAARKQKQDHEPAMHDSPQEAPAAVDDSKFDSDLHVDPFNQAPKDDKHILRNRINNARTDGKLNIAAMGLKEFPEEVRKMYDSAALEESKVNWAEIVDLTKLIAADNEFESLDEALFPDLSFDELASRDDAPENQFGGLESIDLHRNHLQALPRGLRRMERLTSLNLSHNKLDNSAFDVVAQIKTLKDLRLGHNDLSGNVPTSICELSNLETLDLQSNRLLGLPEALRELVHLKVLNVAGNQLTALPMDAIQQLPLRELDASGNALIASLFPMGGPNGHPTLQTINIATNSIAALSFTEPVELPQLRSLDATNNNLVVLPSVQGWTELITLGVGDNKISEFPHGFTTLQKLRNANFTSNEIRLLDPEISKMESLEFLVLASNPLREKKFLTMSAADIKRDLRSRLEPDSEDEPSSPVTVIGDYERPSSMWSLKANGLLDLSSKSLSDELNDTLGSFLNSNEVRQIHLQSNSLTCVPPALWMAQDLRMLDLSSNLMSDDFLSDELCLPSLQELNLSKSRLSSLEPLMTNLQAPSLKTLNVNANRLSGALPALRVALPELSTFYASDNKLTSISADALRGLHTVNLASNNIEQLPAEVGLLWDEGLRILEIGSNAFRVPNYRILDKGTEATLRWLRDRLPAGQGAQVEELD